jgi:hypothetical protein
VLVGNPDAPEFDTVEAREEWIEARINGFHNVYPVSAQFTHDMAHEAATGGLFYFRFGFEPNLFGRVSKPTPFGTAGSGRSGR